MMNFMEKQPRLAHWPFLILKKNGKSNIPPSDWTLIQRRGQYGNSPDYFSLKLWDDYEKGFGCPAKGGASLKRPISFLFPIVLLQSSGLA